MISEDDNLRWDDSSSGSMLVARLNGFVSDYEIGRQEEMFFGILYVVSPEVNALNEQHVDFMKIVASMTASVMWQIATIMEGITISDSTEQQESEDSNGSQ